MIYHLDDMKEAIERFYLRHPDYRKYEAALADYASTRNPLPDETPDEFLERMLSQLVIH